MLKYLPVIALVAASATLFAQEQTGTISGRVLGVDGKPAAGVRVALVAPDADGKITGDILAEITTTDETGHYLIENVPPGRYGIAAGAVSAPTFYPGSATVSGASLLTIQRGSKTTIPDFAIGTPSAPVSESRTMLETRARAITEMRRQLNLPGQMISGRIVIEGPLVSTFLPNLKVVFRRIIGASSGNPFPTFGGTSSTTEVLYSTAIDAKLDGTFRLELKPMPYWLAVGRADSRPLEGFVVKSISAGSTNLLKEELKVNGPVSDEIVITLVSVPIAGPIK